MNTQVSPGQRALGMWQALLGHHAEGLNPESGTQRGIVQQQDATEALLQTALVIDALLQGESLEQAQLLHAMHMLMAARDYVQPLLTSPVGSEDTLRSDLALAVEVIRAGRQEVGVPDFSE